MINKDLIKQSEKIAWHNFIKDKSYLNPDMHKHSVASTFIEHLSSLMVDSFNNGNQDLTPDFDNCKDSLTQLLKDNGIYFRIVWNTIEKDSVDYFSDLPKPKPVRFEKQLSFIFHRNDITLTYCFEDFPPEETGEAISRDFWSNCAKSYYGYFKLRIDSAASRDASFNINHLHLPNCFQKGYCTELLADFVITVFDFIGNLDKEIVNRQYKQNKRETISLIKKTTAKPIIESFLSEKGYRYAVKYGAWKATVGIEIGNNRIAVLGVLYKYLENDLQNIARVVEDMEKALEKFHSTCFLLPNKRMGGGTRFVFEESK